MKFLIRHNTEAQTPAWQAPAPSLGWFLNPQSGVSIHHLVSRNGWRYDLVPRADVAYHCGTSAWGDVRGADQNIGLMNWCSLGMEFENASTLDGAAEPYGDEALWTGAYTEACSLVSYGVTVLDHKQIVLPPEVRHDPSHFPYDVYLPRVQAWVTWLRALPPAELPQWCL